MKIPANLSIEENYRRMIDTPVRKLILSLATPTIVSMLITSFYSLTDTIFVSHTGTTASAAVGIVFSLMSFIQAIGIMFGQGSANVVSRLLGAKDNQKADQVFSTAFFTAVFLALCLSIAGLTHMHGLVRFLGATPTIEPFAIAYGSMILIGAPWMTVCYTMNNNLRSEGKAILGMIGMSSGAIINVVLDPLLIFGFGMGIRGAALATLISQFLSFCILLSHFIKGRSNLHLSLGNIRFSWKLYRDIFTVGLPSLIRNLLLSVSAICLNVFAGPFGDAAISAMTITTRIIQFLNSALIGFGQGFQPVAGFSWGAKRYDRLKESFVFCIQVGVFSFVGIGFLCYLGAPMLVRCFLSDPTVLAIGTVAIRFQCVLMPIMAFNTLSGMLFQCTNHGAKSSILAFCRQGIFFIPLIATLPKVYGILGIQVSQPLADILTFGVSLALVIPFLKQLSKLESSL
ncbi:MATE family efflux transporter [uncultured Sphaerochaeta sp.]|uniref:MATE family efflux transporter n=1 Tax=uncultured Sphaerochaeta sp. TaxID=886478 RepID=UPI002A0A1086|nr:MATE family efflux transporter [uncultured Sphaerochaeta sp.]